MKLTSLWSSYWRASCQQDGSWICGPPSVFRCRCFLTSLAQLPFIPVSLMNSGTWLHVVVVTSTYCLAFSSLLLHSSLPKLDETAELSHISNSECLFFFPLFLGSAFVPRLTLALFPDCIVWFPYTVCGMNSEAGPESFAVQARVVARCWPWRFISLAHEHSGSRKGKIPKLLWKVEWVGWR